MKLAKSKRDGQKISVDEFQAACIVDFVGQRKEDHRHSARKKFQGTMIDRSPGFEHDRHIVI